jgi:hypothetical protein
MVDDVLLQLQLQLLPYDRSRRIGMIRSHLLRAAEGMARAGESASAAEMLAFVREQERGNWPALDQLQ